MKARVLYVPLFIAAEAERFAAVAGDWAEVASLDVPVEQPVEAAHARLDELRKPPARPTTWPSCAR